MATTAPADPKTPTKPYTVMLHPAGGFTPDECGLCEGKCPPAAASLTINGPLGAQDVVLCKKCEQTLLLLAPRLNGRPMVLSVVGVERPQTDMFSDLADAADDGAHVSTATVAPSPEGQDDEGEGVPAIPQLEAPVDQATGEVFKA